MVLFELQRVCLQLAARQEVNGSGQQELSASDAECGGGRWPKGVRRPRWLDVRVVAALSLTASALLPPGAPVVLRSLKLAPLLYMLPARS